MKEHWSYDKRTHKDAKGQRWHFVMCEYFQDDTDYSDSPIEVYFRNDDRTYFGVIRFEQKKDNPYRFDKLVEKVMSNAEFRASCEAPETASVWSRNWK